MAATYQMVKRSRTLQRKRLTLGFGGCCAICKLFDDDVVFDFHHIGNKGFTIGNKIVA